MTTPTPPTVQDRHAGTGTRPPSIRMWCVVTLLTIALGWIRFGHETPDSRHYLTLARYLRGAAPSTDLMRPYAGRILTPLLAAVLPGQDLGFNLALVNLLLTILAHLAFISYLERFTLTARDVSVGMLLVVVSFPVVDYSSGLLTDAGGYLATIVAATLLLQGRLLLVAGVLVVGVLARESLLTMALVAGLFLAFGHREQEAPRGVRRAVAMVALPVLPALTFLAVRRYFADVPSNFWWDISLAALWHNVSSNRVGWITVPLTLGLPTLVIVAALRHGGWTRLRATPAREARLLVALSIVGTVYVVYANVIPTAFLSGRFVWPWYTALVPLAVISGRGTPLYDALLVPIALRIFGRDAVE